MNSSTIQLIDSVRVSRIDWDLIPAPPHAELTGNHLFVNVYYSGADSHESVQSLMDKCNRDFRTICLNSIKHGLLEEVESICVSFFVESGPYTLE